MKKFFLTLVIGLLLVTPLFVGAAGAPSGQKELPAALDQMLARDMIQQAQEQLKAEGFNPGSVDGIFTAQTEQAVRQYQRARGLPASGLLDESTRRVLLPGYDTDGGEG